MPFCQRLLGEDAEELLAAVAVEGVSSAGLRLELGRDGLQDAVAGLVAVDVVVRLEVVDVEQSHAVAVPVADDPPLEQIEILLHGSPVAEPGELVLVGRCR